MYNPSLSQESRYEPASVIPVKKDSSLIDWLAATGRLIPREIVEVIEILDPIEELEIPDPIYSDDLYDDDDMAIEADED
jgi:hypothetical protein